MPLGIFGKLPAKRDFVAQNAPRRFLDSFEPWLQTSVATSRHALGEGWQDAFRHGPIWRFWLGAGLTGATTLGALMPSVDGVGRYFPLAVFALEGEGETLPPPEIDANDAWFEALELVLLDALQADCSYESLLEKVAALGQPVSFVAEIPAGVELLPGGAVLLRDFGEALPTALKVARRANHRASFSDQSFWWTIGGEGFEPSALALSGMPPAALFSGFLTGAFRPGEQA